ncbi:MAG: hypothetical protein J6Y82_00075 [Bacteroidales bacterium]|nr:hypothetical protein [Bacteroidales bacterium]
MKQLTIIVLMAMFCATSVAQTKDVKIFTKSQCTPAISPKPTVDKKTKKTTVAWPSTENSWITDTCWVDAPVCDNFESLFPTSFSVSQGIVLLYWMLTEEDDETVLHCYFKMPADEVTGLWLASEETAIVDMQTGAQYRAKRTAPECMRKHFGVKAAAGTQLDFRIYFPKLDEQTKLITIYGVPLWNLRGGSKNPISLQQQVITRQSEYDESPLFRSPRLERAENNYDRNDHTTWAAYRTDDCLIRPVEDGTMALWRTPEATYLAVAHEQNWMHEYYSVPSGTKLIDDHGRQYKLKELRGLPTDERFWLDGFSGDFTVFVLVFDPLPPYVDTITYIESTGDDFEMLDADDNYQVISNLNVQELRQRQSWFQPLPRVLK